MMMKRWSKAASILCLLAMVLLLFAACGEAKPADDTEEPANYEETETTDEESTLETYQLTLYYPSYAYMVDGTGDELLPYSCELMAEPEDIYIEVARALSSVPEGEDETVYQTAFYDGLSIHDVYEKDGILYVDVASEGLNGGSTEESLLIEQIVESYLHSFADAIKAVQFLVDGSPAETLMGQWDISEPFGHLIDAAAEQ